VSVGQSTRDVAWQDRTGGSAVYVGDVDLPGMLIGRILRSPHPHARIRTIDTSAAVSIPGVAAVITAADMPDVAYTHEIPDRTVLARDVVRFVGEEVAAVAAVDRTVADEAMSRIRVSYRRLRAASTMERALAPKAPRIHQRSSGTNVSLTIEREYGDTDRALHATHRRVRGGYRFGRQAHASMETNGTVASWNPQIETLDLWTSTQSPYFVRKEVATVLGLDASQVRVHEVAVGGGFGAKSKITDHEAIAAWLSITTGRPVRIVLDRDEEFSTTKSRHEFEVDLITGADEKGRLTYRSADVIVDNGAYNHSGPSVMGAGVSALASLYRTDAVSVRSRLVDTNKNPGGQFRGYGTPQVLFAIESQMDELAAELGLDPIDFRIMNANQAGDVTHAGWKLVSARLVECLEAVREGIDWDAKRSRGGDGRGVGVAAAIHVSGARTYENANESAAAVEVDRDGAIRILFGGSDPGTGLRTILAQIGADELGVRAEDITVTTMDTETTTVDLGSWSSRGTFMAGHTARAAAASTASQLRAIAADKLASDPERIRLADGWAHGPHDSIAFGDLVSLAGTGDALRVDESFVIDTELVDRVSGHANISPTYSFAAHAVEVEVDQRTGEVHVLDYVAAHDSGTAINPVALEGQVIGGVAMGLGAALGEELIHEMGRTVNPAYMHYPLPRSADMPAIRPIVLSYPDPAGPYGAKSVGEISINPVPAAVANAVAHATGTRIREVPMTPDRVLTALRAVQTSGWKGRWLMRPSRWWIHLVRAAYPIGLHAVLHRWGTRLGARARPTATASMIEPSDIGSAVASAGQPGAAFIGGGTDLIPAIDQGIATPLVLVDVAHLDALEAMSETPGGALVIGGSVTLADLARSVDAVSDSVLVETIGTIASQQIREMATVAGNLLQEKRCWFFRNGFDCYKRAGAAAPCYAVMGDNRFYHAVLGAHRCQAVTPSDLATTLLALDAVAEVVGQDEARSIPVADLYYGPGETTLRPGELLTRVTIGSRARGRRSAFEKLRLWQGDFAVLSVCASLQFAGDGSIEDARIVLGSVAPTPYRARSVEERLRGLTLSDDLISDASKSWVREADPLEGNSWKVDAACGLLERALHRLRVPSPG
jgi:CO/xanthine dehydrogenase Mo-binding subunit/CO/xanthine dehydrogenase FAD-binding subunit